VTERPPPHAGEHPAEALADWGFPSADIEKLRESGAIA
jgi:crotonobetainyl-CoA:carnitine CoA-transferase CaiB-like acyl-CoA transferase